MRMKKKGGATPCDRRLDRRKVAIAAAAALFLFATEVRANQVDFVLVQASSFLKSEARIYGPGVGDNNSKPQYAGSDTTTYYGHIYVDIQPTTIQLMPGSTVNAEVGAKGFPGFPTPQPNPGTPEAGTGPNGLFYPKDPVTQDPDFVNPGQEPNSNYGLQIPGLGVLSEEHGLRMDNGNSFAPSTPMGLAGTSFNLAGQGMGFTQGRQAFVSGLGNDSSDVVGDPSIFFGTNGTDIGTWNGTTLTIPVHSKFTFNVTTGFGGINEDAKLTGQLVAIPYVPEPSTMTLVGFGVVGLLSYAWRARKRKTLVA